MNQTLIWLLLLPLVLGILLWFFNRTREEAIIGAGIFTGVAFVLTGAIFFMSTAGATNDIEIWNGQVTAKNRKHDTYEESYDCRCRTVTSYTGSGKDRRATTTRVCDTCYRTHYTVKWSCDTTVGGFNIASEDETSRRVYDTPDPASYTAIQIGEPASARRSYTNYIQAVPESLFKPSSEALRDKFAQLIPAYPDKVYDRWKVDRVLTPGFAMPDIAEWNAQLAESLKVIGPQKQVNAIIVIVKTDDPNYEYALRDAWEGANKNDVVVIIGSTSFPKIEWVRVISWTKNELFKVQLRDTILEMNVVNRSIIPAIRSQIADNFERRHMKDFQYLDGEIDPPTWLITTLVVLLVGSAVGVHIFLSYYTRNPRNFRLRS